MTPKEKERRYHIILAGRDSDFWKVLKDSLVYVASEKLKTVADLLQEGKTHEASLLQAEYRMLLYLADEPQRIISANRSLFEEYYYDICDKCRTILKKFRPKTEKTKSTEEAFKYV